MDDAPIVAEVRQIREELAGRFDFDVHAIFADLRRRQVQLGDRLVCRTAARHEDGATGGSGAIARGR